MKPSIKNIIFDIGNVLCMYSPKYIIEAILPKSSHKDFYLKELFNADIWQQLDRGDINTSTAIKTFKTTFNISLSQEKEISQLIQDFPLYLIINKKMKNVFIEACKQFNVYILSNFQDTPFDTLLNIHPFLKQAKGMVISGKILMKKPEIGIYHYLLTQYRLLPKESIFIDDKIENIQTAKKILIHSIHFQSENQLLKELEKHNIIFQCPI